MAYTVQQVLDKARIPLNDNAKDRYSDESLLGYFNDAYKICRKKRPDLFLGRLSTPITNLLAGDSFPVDEIYVPYFADYVAGRAETLDDENINNSRAQALIQNFMMGILT